MYSEEVKISLVINWQYILIGKKEFFLEKLNYEILRVLCKEKYFLYFAICSVFFRFSSTVCSVCPFSSAVCCFSRLLFLPFFLSSAVCFVFSFFSAICSALPNFHC